MTLADALYVYIAYLTRGRVDHDEVLCRRCYEEMDGRGAFDHNRPGQLIQVKPWGGAPRCGGCEERQFENRLTRDPDAFAGGFADNN